MGKLKSLITGSLLGAAGMYVGLQYHVLQAEEGFLIVPRIPQQRVQDAYADIRGWDAATWTARSRMALAVTEHGRSDLISDGIASNVLDDLRSSIAPLRQELQNTSRGWEPSTTTSTPPPERTSPSVDSLATPSSPAAAPQPRRGFLPLADLFGIGRDAAGSKTSSVLPDIGRSDKPSVTPVMPAGVARPKGVEILPSPGEIEILHGPNDVQLGPSAPIPGQRQRIDRRRTDATGRWQPMTVKSF